MSVHVMTWVWQQSRSKKNARLLLLAIADCANDAGLNAFPSVTELMRKTGLSERGVQSTLADLVALGELVVYRNAGPGGCNRYRVVMTPAEYAPPQDLHPAKSAPSRSRTPQKTTAPPAESAPGTVLEPPVKISSSKRSSSEVQRLDVEQLCRHLADRVEANGSKRPTITPKWREAARLLLDRDGRTVEQVMRAIDWCQGDDFWRANVLSMPKLREQYDRLRLAAQRATPARKSTTDERVNAALALADELERRQLP